jgi:ABC-type glycerol-3-phosphate transport system substrate-binding protein
MSKKGRWCTLASIGLAVAIAGCSTGSPGAGKASDKETEQIPASLTEPVELSFRLYVGSITNEEQFMKVFGNKIRERFPNVTPKLIPSNESMKSILENNRSIDIIYDAYGQLYKNLIDFKMQYDLSDLIKKYKYDLTPLEPSAVEAMRQVAGGGLYGLPVSIDTVNMIYNKELFDRFGVPYPKDGMTWEETYELARKMSRTENGVKYYGMVLSPQHTTLGDQLSPDFIGLKDNTANLSSDKFKQVFQTLTHYFTLPGNEVDDATWGFTAQRKLFSENKVAMLLGASALGTRFFADNYKELDWDLASYPRYKELPMVGPQLAPGYFLIPSNSVNKDMAFQVTAFVTSKEFQMHLSRNGYWPALKDPVVWNEYGKELPFMEGKNIKAMIPDNPALIAPLSKYQGLALPQIQTAFKDVLVGKKDLNTALREADERLNRSIEAELKQ